MNTEPWRDRAVRYLGYAKRWWPLAVVVAVVAIVLRACL